MRLSRADGRSTRLTYCTNVHPIEDLDAAIEALSRYCRPVRERLGVPRFSLGLWLSRRASAKLASSDEEVERLSAAMTENGLELVTLNGFPYGDFHAERVKEEVYRPDWSDPRRVEYTLDLARVLAHLLPADVEEGTISTLPLGHRLDRAAVEASAMALVRLAAELERLSQNAGRPVRVCIEPEPECVIETTPRAIRFFTDDLMRAAKAAGVGRETVERHLGLCFDACHQATEFEDAASSWRAIRQAGIRVGKVQLSCAIEVPDASTDEAAEHLRPFDEIRFLHQVRCRGGAGEIEHWLDLGQAFDEREGAARRGDWRVHFHVPLHWTPEGRLRTTSGSLRGLVAEIAKEDRLPHLEVETYTWTVLPEDIRPRDDGSLIDGLVREVVLAESLFAEQGIRRDPHPSPLPGRERGSEGRTEAGKQR